MEHETRTRVCSYVLPASSSCHVCGFSACLVRVGDMSRHVLYVMFTQDLDLRWHVYDGLLVQAPACWPHAGMQLRAACVVFLPCLWFLGMFSACW